MLSEIAPQKVKDKKVLVVGCGGLGGYVVEHLVRIGVGEIVVADNDSFCMSNLNRQLVSNLKNIGMNKAEEAKKRAACINEGIKITPIREKVNKTNIKDIAEGCDLIFDCCDNIQSRLMLEQYCERANKVLIHAAINDVCGQVATVYPFDRTVSKLYSQNRVEQLPTLSYVPGVVAALQVSEGIKALLGKKELTLQGKTLILDLLTNDIKIL